MASPEQQERRLRGQRYETSPTTLTAFRVCTDSGLDINVVLKKSRLCGSPIICHRTAAVGKSSLSVHRITFQSIVTHFSLCGSANNWSYVVTHSLNQNRNHVWMRHRNGPTSMKVFLTHLTQECHFLADIGWLWFLRWFQVETCKNLLGSWKSFSTTLIDQRPDWQPQTGTFAITPLRWNSCDWKWQRICEDNHWFISAATKKSWDW